MSKEIKIAVTVGVGIMALGAVLLLAQPKQGQETANNSHTDMDMGSDKTVSNILASSETLHDFGTISMKNGKVTNVFKVKNITSQPVTLTRLYTSCMCTDASLKINDKTEGPFGMLGHGFVPRFSDSLAAGQEAEVIVVFDPNAHGPAGVGTIERTVTVEGPDGKLAELNIKATVTP